MGTVISSRTATALGYDKSHELYLYIVFSVSIGPLP